MLSEIFVELRIARINFKSLPGGNLFIQTLLVASPT